MRSDQDEGFLDRPALRIPRPSIEPPGVWAAGYCIGPFRLARRLGAGGMGEVWLAERAQGEFTQRVALKMMLPGTSTAQERFRAERQILAELDHPGIAHLYDGGVTENGWPWMAMEYVEGEDLLSWCQAHRSSLQERLDLFLQVCDAAAYAHAHLVVHRDLKPSNIFVAHGGRVKLLDFGIAKLLSVEARTDATQTAMLSPAYAAPEQLKGGRITTATDVFALGVTLHQLLTGRLPWPAEGALGGALKRLLAEPPPAPSRVTDGTVPARLLSGDLDAIVSKALRSDPDARYADARAFAEDVRRHLNHEPVQARSGARAYVARRFMRRHWLPLSAAAALFLALLAGLSGIAWQAQRAEREAARATAIQDFLIGVFKASDPRIAQDKPRGEVTARELLDASVARIDRDFASDPAIRIRLLGVASDIYGELGEDERYEQLHRRYLGMARNFYGERHPIVLAALLDIAVRAKDRYEHGEARRLLAELDPMFHEAKLDRTALRARWWLTQGQALMNESSKTAEQVAALRKAQDLFAEVAPRDPAYVTALADLGAVHSNRMDFEVARRYMERAIEVSQTIPERNDAELATIYGNLGLIAQNLGDFAGADAAYARSAEIIRVTYGPSRPVHWVPAANRARAAHLGGNRQRADTLFLELLGQIPADTTHHDAAEAREWYGGCLAADGRADQAVPLLEAAERLYQSTYLYDFELPRVRATLGDAYDRLGRTEDARRMLKAALDQRVATNPADYQPVLAIRERWGRFLLSQGDLDGAEAQFREVLTQAHDRKLAHVALAYGGLARVELARGRVAEAIDASRRAIDGFEHVTGFRDVRMGPQLWLVHSEVLRRSGDSAGARAWAQKALEARRRYDHPDAPSIREAEAALRTLARS